MSLGDRSEYLVLVLWEAQIEGTRILPSHTIHRISCDLYPSSKAESQPCSPAVTGTLSPWTCLCSSSKVFFEVGLPSALQCLSARNSRLVCFLLGVPSLQTLHPTGTNLYSECFGSGQFTSATSVYCLKVQLIILDY